MTDIVERLRLKKTLKTVEDVHELFADAADEIERLRELLRPFACGCTNCCLLPENFGLTFIKDCPRFKARSALEEKD